MNKLWRRSPEGGLFEEEHRSFVFPGGEPHVTVTRGMPTLYGLERAILDDATDLLIEAHIQNGNDLLELFALTDACKRLLPSTPITLYMPYFPGARQDRVASSGEALTVKMYADLINLQDYDVVIVVDPHSDVTPALIDRCKVIKQTEVIRQFRPVDGDGRLDYNAPGWYDGIICPDAGARKKCYDVAALYTRDGDFTPPVLPCDKVRNVKTGKLDRFVLNFEFSEVFGHTNAKYYRYLLADDICDGGGTFIGLGKLFAEKGVKPDLYVTHGIFSKGLDELFQYYNRILTTNSWLGNKSIENQEAYGKRFEMIDTMSLFVTR